MHSSSNNHLNCILYTEILIASPEQQKKILLPFIVIMLVMSILSF